MLGSIGLVLGLRSNLTPPPSSEIGPPRTLSPPVDTGRLADGGVRPGDSPRDPVGPAKPAWPALYQPSVPLALDTLRKQFLGPWEGQADPGPEVPVLRVPRVPAGGGAYGSLRAACAAAVPGRLTVIEIEDNGPLFEAPVAVADRSLVIRAARGYRPLLVWDADRRRPGAGKESPIFLGLTHGNLTLEGIDLVSQWPEAPAARSFLVRVSDGDLVARDCTFSLSGRQPADLGVVRFERIPASGPPSSTAARCRLTRCVARGPGLVLLDVDAAGADVLLDGCLAVGTDQPLVQVAGRNLAPTVLRFLRSTLVAEQALLRVRPATVADIRPDVQVHAWDALLARAGTQAGGQMVVLGGSTQSAHMKWQATNSLYTGWRTLLASTYESIDDLRAWQSAWQRAEGDLALAPAGPPCHGSTPPRPRSRTTSRRPRPPRSSATPPPRGPARSVATRPPCRPYAPTGCSSPSGPTPRRPRR